MRVAALLRGINLAGSRRLGMATLRSSVEALGHTDVATYQQSGNVVFRPAKRQTSDAMEKAITAALAHETGVEIPVLVRTGAELAKIVAANPFDVDDPRFVVVAFLGEGVDARWLKSVDRQEFAPDDFTLVGRQVYLSVPNGQARSALVETFWKHHRNDLVTARNWRTVTALADLTA